MIQRKVWDLFQLWKSEYFCVLRMKCETNRMIVILHHQSSLRKVIANHRNIKVQSDVRMWSLKIIRLLNIIYFYMKQIYNRYVSYRWYLVLDSDSLKRMADSCEERVRVPGRVVLRFFGRFRNGNQERRTWELHCCSPKLVSTYHSSPLKYIDPKIV